LEFLDLEYVVNTYFGLASHCFDRSKNIELVPQKWSVIGGQTAENNCKFVSK